MPGLINLREFSSFLRTVIQDKEEKAHLSGRKMPFYLFNFFCILLFIVSFQEKDCDIVVEWFESS